jgi:2-C-methyl-D-erythritol 4-phosphate cytidylyltransferase
VTAQLDARGDVAVLVVAAGLGVRLGAGRPKALRPLAGQPLLVHAVRRVAAARSVGCVVVAAPPSEVVAVGELVGPGVLVVAGGPTRQASVAAALAGVPDRYEIVLVHDAARALAPTALMEAVAGAVRDGADAVIPVLPVVDTVKEVAASGTVVGTVDRSVLRAVQTPQGFRRAVLVAAHRAAGDEHTDDAGLVEKLGVPVQTVPGDEAAFKITRPVDLMFAEALLAGGTLAS